MASESKKLDKKSNKGPSPEEVLNGFQALRADQRNLATKLSEFELDLNEHKLVKLLSYCTYNVSLNISLSLRTC